MTTRAQPAPSADFRQFRIPPDLGGLALRFQLNRAKRGCLEVDLCSENGILRRRTEAGRKTEIF
ncbi:MAG: hypothetical protein EBS01_05125 [Verrucomicrobia bacterium]|nr:hypothetical protein [Verrucomicrobiota bacterium]